MLENRHILYVCQLWIRTSRGALIISSLAMRYWFRGSLIGSSHCPCEPPRSCPSRSMTPILRISYTLLSFEIIISRFVMLAYDFRYDDSYKAERDILMLWKHTNRLIFHQVYIYPIWVSSCLRTENALVNIRILLRPHRRRVCYPRVCMRLQPYV